MVQSHRSCDEPPISPTPQVAVGQSRAVHPRFKFPAAAGVTSLSLPFRFKVHRILRLNQHVLCDHVQRQTVTTWGS